MKILSDQLQERENELQTVTTERITNLKTIEGHKQQLKDLEGKIKEFGKYEGIIEAKFENLENFMNEMTAIREEYSKKESQLKEGIFGLMELYYII